MSNNGYPENTFVDRVRTRKTTNNITDAMAVSPTKPLTEQQKKFVRYWAEGDTVNNAMARAGYINPGSFGYRLIRMPNVLAVYNDLKRKYEDAAQMTRKKVMDMHKEAFDMAKLMSEPSSMVAAAREIGRMCGYYEPVKVRVDLSVSGHLVMEKMNQLSDEDLLRIITEGTGTASNTELLGLDEITDGDEGPE